MVYLINAQLCKFGSNICEPKLSLFGNAKRMHRRTHKLKERHDWDKTLYLATNFESRNFPHPSVKLFPSTQIETIAKFSEKSKQQVLWVFFLCRLKTVSQVFSLVVVVLRGMLLGRCQKNTNNGVQSFILLVFYVFFFYACFYHLYVFYLKCVFYLLCAFLSFMCVSIFHVCLIFYVCFYPLCALISFVCGLYFMCAFILVVCFYRVCVVLSSV